MKAAGSVGSLFQGFLVEHLLRHKRVSPHTVLAYRDTFRLLLGFLSDTHGLAPAAVRLADFDVHLEQQRQNTIRTRNARLAALRSFFRYVALREPDHLALATQVLAIPSKRTNHRLVGYCTRPEIDALLEAPDRTTRAGRRDHALLLTLTRGPASRRSRRSGALRSALAPAPRSSCTARAGKSERSHSGLAPLACCAGGSPSSGRGRMGSRSRTRAEGH